jgi:GH43 family beta-xylosidase
MKLHFDIKGKKQPDPFVIGDGDKYYMYVTATEGDGGVEAYSADDPLGLWHYEGEVARFEGAKNYWAPSVIKYRGKYYMYVSCEKAGAFQHMHVAESDSPLGPFVNEKMLYDRFTIDSHMVETEAGLFLFYAENRYECEGRIGTRVFVDRFIDPYTPANAPAQKIIPTFDEEMFTPDCTETRKWHTVEGPFLLTDGEYQYLMYSGGCYQDDTYHVGYAVAKSDEQDLTRVEFEKVTRDGTFSPILIKNSFEEGCGHNSVLKIGDSYYAYYHGRDYKDTAGQEYREERTARVCRLNIHDGIITAEMYEDHV